jgi:LacI family transcriptional regulator
MAQAKNREQKRVTINQIATHAGVSIGSVSSVLNNRHVERRISLAAVTRIRRAVEQLGYLPNISARRLRGGSGVKNNVVIAFITSYQAPLAVINQFVYALHEAVAEGKSPRDLTYSLLVEMFAAGRLRDMPGLLTGDHFNAAIIANTVPEDDRFLRGAHLPYPVVLVNRSIPRYSSVIEDPATGARAAEILVQARRRRLVVLQGTPLTQGTQTRVDGFLAASAQLLGRPSIQLSADSLTEAAGYEAMARFIDQGGKADGLYAVTDSMALGAYHAIKQKKLRIPRDIAVIGVGDYEIGPFLDPPLSSVGPLRDEIGHEVSRVLLAQLYRTGATPLTTHVASKTLLRASTGH